MAAVWVVWAFAQEAWTAHALNRQVADMRQRNAALERQNDDYRRDISAVRSGAAAEEVARQNGYARPSEKVYVVGNPPPAPPPALVRMEKTPGPLDGLAAWLGRLLHLR